jgi:hypothetical protein
VAAHAGVMECLRRAMLSDMSEVLAIKLRTNAVQMNRMFSGILRDMERLQSKPLPRRPEPPPPPRESAEPPRGPVPGESPPFVPMPDDVAPVHATGEKPRAKRARSKASEAVSDATGCRAQAPAASNTTDEASAPLPPHGNGPNDDGPDDDGPDDIETRPDGTPGSMAAYAPKAPPEVYVPREPAIMIALATRPRPWRMVNEPAGQTTLDATDPGETASPTADARGDRDASAPAAMPGPFSGRGPLDLKERIFTGDALARFASARVDPDAPVECFNFEDDEAVVELELISTGNDPAAEAERAALIAAHPDGKPIVTFRYGNKKAPDDPPGSQ